MAICSDFVAVEGLTRLAAPFAKKSGATFGTIQDCLCLKNPTWTKGPRPGGIASRSGGCAGLDRRAHAVEAGHRRVSGGLTPYIRHYLTVVRPALLDGRVHDALWINLRGGPWSAECMAQRIRLLSRQRFGESFGPHRFRHDGDPA
jgi:hypothetical protein